MTPRTTSRRLSRRARSTETDLESVRSDLVQLQINLDSFRYQGEDRMRIAVAFALALVVCFGCGTTETPTAPTPFGPVAVDELVTTESAPHAATASQVEDAMCRLMEAVGADCDDNGGGGGGGGGGDDDDDDDDDTPGHPPIQRFQNCTAMRGAGWMRGVNRNGGTYQPSWNAAERQTYNLNTHSDRDNDGHACET